MTQHQVTVIYTDTVNGKTYVNPAWHIVYNQMDDTANTRKEATTVARRLAKQVNGFVKVYNKNW